MNNEIMELMEQIEYGWVDNFNNKHDKIDNTYSNTYKLQSPKEVVNSKVGVCWDQVELERFYFENSNFNIKTYFIVYYDNGQCPSHTFLTYTKDEKTYWFEHSWEKYRGNHEYNNLNEVLTDVRNKFINDELNNNYDKKSLCIYEYSKPKKGISAIDFYQHCEKGKNINIES